MPSRLERDRPLGVHLLLRDRLRLEPPDLEVRLRGQRLDSPQQVADVLLFRQHGTETIEARLQVGDLGAELRELAGGVLPFHDLDAKGIELSLLVLDVRLRR